MVGAGLGGLAAACFLARAGARVLLLERDSQAGGLCRTVGAGGYRWNLALYSLRGCQPGGPFDRVLQDLGLGEGVSFVRSDDSYEITGPEGVLVLSRDLEKTLESARRVAPGSVDGVGRLLRRIVDFDLTRDYGGLAHAAFEEVLTAHVPSPALQALFAAPLWVSLGLPPGRVSALFAFQKLQTVLRDGVFFPRGGAEALAAGLLGRFLELGGTFRPESDVTRVRVAEGRARAVETSAEEAFAVRAVVSGGDATRTMLELVGREHLPPRYATEVEAATLTLSAVVTLLGLSAPASPGFQAHHRIWTDGSSYDRLYRALDAGEARPGAAVLGAVSQSALEPAFAPCGGESLSLFCLAPRAAGGDGAAGRLGSEALARAEACLPGLGAKTVVQKTLCPADLKALTAGRGGAIGGWEALPGQVGLGRLKPRTPVANLYLAGHWTTPGASALNAALSGRAAAERVLRDLGLAS